MISTAKEVLVCEEGQPQIVKIVLCMKTSPKTAKQQLDLCLHQYVPSYRLRTPFPAYIDAPLECACRIRQNKGPRPAP